MVEVSSFVVANKVKQFIKHTIYDAADKEVACARAYANAKTWANLATTTTFRHTWILRKNDWFYF